MEFDNKPVQSIAEADFARLVDDAISESRTIEYKSRLDLETTDRKKIFLKHVSALANTDGGHLLFGVQEDKGVPVAIPGIDVDDADALLLRIESLIRDGIEPRVQGIRMAVVPLSAGRHVLVLRIPKSWNSPHVVRFQNHGRFYGRNSAGVFSLDVNELRSAFLQSATMVEKARQFRLDRLMQIKSGESPLGFHKGAKAVLHLVPFQAFTPGHRVDFQPVLSHMVHLPQLSGRGSHDQRFTLDGYLETSQRNSGECYSSTLLFRQGIIETVDTRSLEPHDDRPLIGCERFEDDLIRAVRQFQKSMPALQLEPPYVVFYTMLSVKGYGLGVGPGRDMMPIDRDDLLIPEVLCEGDPQEPRYLLRPIFDAVWNGCGYRGSMSYDVQDRWCR